MQIKPILDVNCYTVSKFKKSDLPNIAFFFFQKMGLFLSKWAAVNVLDQKLILNFKRTCSIKTRLCAQAQIFVNISHLKHA